MNKILKKVKLTDNIYQYELHAPHIAESAKPGQFIILIPSEKGERLPLTIKDTDIIKGTISIVFQVVGISTTILANLNEGSFVNNLVGPLGSVANYVDTVVKNQRYVLIAGGVGVAPIYPQLKYLVKNGASVDVIIGARDKANIILEKEISQLANKVYITTDDGSKGIKGRVTEQLEMLLSDENTFYNHAICIGPLIMMKFVCQITNTYGLSTTVSVNPVMVDGTGMCGACRLTVNNDTKFACIDGPEFNGHQVNFDELIMRQNSINSNKGMNNYTNDIKKLKRCEE